MNAPVKLTLDELYRQRNELRKKQADIQASREKLSSVDKEADEATSALVAFADASTNAVNLWCNSGCSGDRPVADAAKQAKLVSTHTAAHTAVLHAQGVRGSLDRREEAIADALYQNRVSVEDQAALVIAVEVKQRAKRAAELREELKREDAWFLAVRDRFQALAKEWYDDFKYDVPRPSGRHSGSIHEFHVAKDAAGGASRHAFRAAQDEAAKALVGDNPLAPIAFTSAERADLLEVEAQFDKLVAGG